MEKLTHQLALDNFSLDCELDKMLFHLCRGGGADTGRQLCEELLRDLCDEKLSRGAVLSQLAKLPPTDTRYWVKEALEEKMKVMELLAVVKALDAKMSLLAMQVEEPHPGYFQHVGVTAADPFKNCPPPAPQARPLRLVKR